MFDYIKENGVYLFITLDGLHFIGTIIKHNTEDKFFVINLPMVVYPVTEESFPVPPQEELPESNDFSTYEFEPLGTNLADCLNHVININSIMSICMPSAALYHDYLEVVQEVLYPSATKHFLH